MTGPAVTLDFSGVNPIVKFSWVRVVNREHKYYGRMGTVIRVEHPMVWVAMPGGLVIKASRLSLVRVAR